MLILRYTGSMGGNVTLGQSIKSHRRARGWKQAELSRRSGIKQSYISQLENDLTTRPGWDTLQRLATAFGVTVDDLVSGVTIPLPGPIDQLEAEGLPDEVIEELAVIWPDLLPEDRRAVIEITRSLWERRRRQKSQHNPGGEAISEA